MLVYILLLFVHGGGEGGGASWSLTLCLLTDQLVTTVVHMSQFTAAMTMTIIPWSRLEL